MNSCVLMVRVLEQPQLRYTADNQTEVAEMMVEFDSTKLENPPSRLKVVGWRNLAVEMQEKYEQGDQLIIQGSLRMNVFERKEGFKEKRAELTASRIHKVGEYKGEQKIGEEEVYQSTPASTNRGASNVVSMDSYKPATTQEYEYADSDLESSRMKTTTEPVKLSPKVAAISDIEEQNLDDIPF